MSTVHPSEDKVTLTGTEFATLKAKAGGQLHIILSERVLGLVAEAAQESGCKSSTWARQILYAALRASGRDPVAVFDGGTFEQGAFDTKASR